MDAGLTKQQKDTVRASWGKFKANAVANGTGFYLSLFKSYPDTFNAFKPLFKDLGIHQLNNHPTMKAQALVFVDAISSFVDHLDDNDVLVVLIQKNAKLHFNRGLRIKHFHDAYGLLIHYLQENFHIDGATKEAWEKLVAFICRIMDEHMRQLS